MDREVNNGRLEHPRRSRSLRWNEHSTDRQLSQKGPHRGKGPKGYRRSDERIEEEVNQALTDDSELDATSIVVRVQGGDVMLTGIVSTREDKRRAEDCIEHISGVNNIENCIKINHNSASARSKTASFAADRGMSKAKRRDHNKA
jgi:hypothetical protein